VDHEVIITSLVRNASNQSSHIEPVCCNACMITCLKMLDRFMSSPVYLLSDRGSRG